MGSNSSFTYQLRPPSFSSNTACGPPMERVHDSLHRHHLRGALPSVAVTLGTGSRPGVATRLRVHDDDLVRLRPVVEPGVRAVWRADKPAVRVLPAIPRPVQAVAPLDVHSGPVEVQMEPAPAPACVAAGEAGRGDVRHAKVGHAIVLAPQRGLVELNEAGWRRQVALAPIAQAVLEEELQRLASAVEAAVVDERPALLRARVAVLQRRDRVRGVDLVNLICENRFRGGLWAPFLLCGPQTALKCSYRSDSVTWD